MQDGVNMFCDNLWTKIDFFWGYFQSIPTTGDNT